MALTPEDVVNKRFQPTKFREGYDQDEVDDFLDEVVVELRRLNQETEELRQKLVSAESRVSELQRSGGGPSASAPSVTAPVVSAPADSVPAPEPAPVPEPQPEPAPVSVPTPVPAAAAVPPTPAFAAPTADTDASNTTNLLQLARRLHEEHVKEGIEKRDSLIAEGHATAARIASEAEAKQRAQIAQLDQERAVLEHRIDELRTFEKEYRQKLKSYIEGQLRDLDTPGSSDSVGAGSSSASGLKGVGGI